MAEGDVPAVPAAVSDHDLLMRLIERSAWFGERLKEIVEWKHDLLPQVIVGIQKELAEVARGEAALRAEVTSACGAVKELTESVRLLTGMPAVQAAHENECVRARVEDIQHRDAFERKVDQRFDAGEKARQELHQTINHTRNWVVGGVISTLLTLLAATVSIIWVVVQKGGLGLLH